MVARVEILLSGGFLENGDGPALHCLSLGIAGLEKQQLCQVTQTICNLRVFLTKRVLQNRQGLTVEWLSLCMTALNCMNVSQIDQAVGYFGTIGCVGFRYSQGALGQGYDFVVGFSVKAESSQIVQGTGELHSLGKFFPNGQRPPVERFGLTEPSSGVVQTSQLVAGLGPHDDLQVQTFLLLPARLNKPLPPLCSALALEVFVHRRDGLAMRPLPPGWLFCPGNRRKKLLQAFLSSTTLLHATFLFPLLSPCPPLHKFQ